MFEKLKKLFNKKNGNHQQVSDDKREEGTKVVRELNEEDLENAIGGVPYEVAVEKYSESVKFDEPLMEKVNPEELEEKAIFHINETIDFWMSENGTSRVLYLLDSIKENIDLLETYFPNVDWSKVNKESIYNKLFSNSEILEEEHKRKM